MFSKIIVPLDGSEFGEIALSTALGLATESGAKVCLATVVSILTPPRYTHPVISIDQETYRDAEAHARAYQRLVVEKIRKSGIDVPISTFVGVGRVVDTLDRKVRESGSDLLVIATHGRGPLMRSWLGSVADGILEFARQKRPDAVALTTHGRGGISRMLLGSIADKVVRAAHGPVLVYRST